MSDIIYTPPASSGGGQNPTANYIPLNDGTSNFVDSFIFQDSVNKVLYLTDDYGLTNFGLLCNKLNNNYIFGEITNGSAYYSATVNVSEVFGNDISRITSTNKQEFLNSGSTSEFITQDQNGLQGLYFNFSTAEFFFGDWNNVYNAWQTALVVKPNGNLIQFVNKSFSMGITPNDGCFFTTQKLTFTGSAIESTSSGGSSGKHLVINLNGNQYKIRLDNP